MHYETMSWFILALYIFGTPRGPGKSYANTAISTVNVLNDRECRKFPILSHTEICAYTAAVTISFCMDLDRKGN